MDKRSLLFVIALTFSVFAVNLYFTHNSGEKNKEWIEQQKAKKIQQEKKLTLEIEQRTAHPDELPIVQLFSDSQIKEQLTTGVQIGNVVIVLPWSNELPSSIFMKNKEDGKGEELLLIAGKAIQGTPVLYSKDPKANLQITLLPEFGKFDLQLVAPQPKDLQVPFKIVLGEDTDGHFLIPADRLSKEPKVSATIGNAIALLKTPDGYLPAGIYQHEKKTLLEFEEFLDLSNHITIPQAKIIPTGAKKEEKYFVIENEFQQLVFSNRGGALVEINLPFTSKEDPNSVVREIEFDRQMVKNHPYNAHFPAHAYSTPGSSPSEPFIEHASGKLGGYYPLLRRDLIEARGKKSIQVPAANYAFNLISEYPEVAELIYEVKAFTKDMIVFEAVQSHRRITKTYTLTHEGSTVPYSIHLAIKIEGDGRGLWVTSGIPEVEWISGSIAPALKYRITRNQKAEVTNIDLPADSITVSTVSPNWICNSNGFLGLIIQPLTEIDGGYKAYRVSGTVSPSRLIEIDQEYQRFKAEDLPGYAMALPLKSNNGTMQFRIYAGPFAESTLKATDKAFTDPITGENPDYIACQSFHGWFAFISEPFARFLFILMKFFHYLTGSWGFSIILLTIALRLMLYPLNAWSMKSMARMQQIAPEVAAIQERNKKDQKKAQMEIMNLYKERGVNPISGCFPMLIQMPFLIGMFDLLKSTFELRGASFIPGWIDNLTAPDVLFSWKYPIFFIGNEFHLLPILLGLVMFLQQRLMSPLPRDANLLTDQQRQQRVMGNVMTLVFAIMFYNFPSGLNIYWLSSMLLGVLQQWFTNRQMKSKPILIVEGAKASISKKKR